MIKLYDDVKVKSNGKLATVVEIDDDHGMRPPAYLVELVDKSDSDDVVFWCDWDEVEEIK